MTRYYRDNLINIKVDKWSHVNNKWCNNYNDERKRYIIEQKFNHSYIHHYIYHNCDKLKYFSYKYPDTSNSSKASISNKTCNSSNWLIMIKSIHHEYDISSYKFINEFSHEYDSYDSSINEFITLNTISNIKFHINLIALNVISNMKHFIINFIILNMFSNMKYSITYSIALIMSSNMDSQNSNSVTIITSSNTNSHDKNFITLITWSNMKYLFNYYNSKEFTLYKT